MKSIITAVVVGLFLFVASAGMSWWLIYTPPETEDQEAVAEAPASEFPVDVAKDDQQEIMPVSLRPETPLSLEAVAGLAETIMKKEKTVFDAEQALKKEEQRIALLFDDLKREEEELSAFAGRIETMIMEAKQAVKLLQMEKEAIAKKSDELTKFEKKVGVKGEEVKETQLSMDAKEYVKLLDRVDSAETAGVLKELANSGELKLAGEVLRIMPDRQRADIVEDLKDPVLVAELLTSSRKSQTESSSKRVLR